MARNVNLFKAGPLSASAIDKVSDIREAFEKLANEVIGIAPSRENSLAQTHLELACMYAVKDVSIKDREGTPDAYPNKAP